MSPPIARRSAAALAAAALLVACVYGTSRPPDAEVAPDLRATADAPPLVVADALEALIARGEASAKDKEWAYVVVKGHRVDDAGSAFARATTAGRVAELAGLNAPDLVREAERFARQSRAYDPDFRDGAAQRMLGTLYVHAPARMVRHGDSEVGLGLLEDLAERYPTDPATRLRLGEAYVVLGDEAGGVEHLCAAAADDEDALRADDRALLRDLMREAGVASCESPSME